MPTHGHRTRQPRPPDPVSLCFRGSSFLSITIALRRFSLVQIVLAQPRPRRPSFSSPSSFRTASAFRAHGIPAAPAGRQSGPSWPTPSPTRCFCRRRAARPLRVTSVLQRPPAAVDPRHHLRHRPRTARISAPKLIGFILGLAAAWSIFPPSEPAQDHPGPRRPGLPRRQPPATLLYVYVGPVP